MKGLFHTCDNGYQAYVWLQTGAEPCFDLSKAAAVGSEKALFVRPRRLYYAVDNAKIRSIVHVLKEKSSTYGLTFLFHGNIGITTIFCDYYFSQSGGQHLTGQKPNCTFKSYISKLKHNKIIRKEVLKYKLQDHYIKNNESLLLLTI